jgi:hypothetical protein
MQIRPSRVTKGLKAAAKLLSLCLSLAVSSGLAFAQTATVGAITQSTVVAITAQ